MNLVTCVTLVINLWGWARSQLLNYIARTTQIKVILQHTALIRARNGSLYYIFGIKQGRFCEAHITI